MAIKQYASFYVGDNLFGIDIRLIREINRNVDITPVDSAPDFVRGLLNLRGQIVTVIDVGIRLGLQMKEQGKGHCRCIVLKTTDELSGKRDEDPTIEDTSRDLVALHVDDIGDIVMLDEKDIEPPPANVGDVEGKYVYGIADRGESLLIILKMAELLLQKHEKHEKKGVREVC
jgi:purine-binding chemotaxis protein CheW